MADNYIVTETEKGKINILDDVIAVMVGAAITEVEGVAGPGIHSAAADIVEVIGKKNLSKGVKITLEADRIIVDVLVIVAFGCVVTDVAEKVQNAIANAIESMTGFPSTVNVHVSGVSFKKA